MTKIDKSKIAVVIPVYKQKLSNTEVVALKQGARLLKDYDLILTGPMELDYNYYEQLAGRKCKIELFSSDYFANISGYNRLLLSRDFYKTFLAYEYILIYQLDAFVFSDQLAYWCQRGYDYIGAPFIDPEWIKNLDKKLKFPISRWINKVGNGGFSLRKVQTFYRASIALYPVSYIWKYNEDFFWSSIAIRLYPGFKIPDMITALQFSFEDKPSVCYQLNDYILPFGCHAWEKHDPDFWKPILLEYGYEF